MSIADECPDKYESNPEKAFVHAQKRLRDRGPRDVRVNNAEIRLKNVMPEWLRVEKEHREADIELQAAKNAFYEGERVKVTETCRRGCCVEYEYIGLIVGAAWNGRYIVRTCDDKLHFASHTDMEII